MTRRLQLIVALAACLIPIPCLAAPVTEGLPPDLHLNDPKPTTILVRVVANGSMVLGKDVGGARVTITDVATKQILATGIQQGDAGDHVLERLQMFYSGEQATFEAPFFVPLPNDAPDGIALRVIAADPVGGNFGMSQAKYPVLSERLRPHQKSDPR
jgi:hypothetical protein